MRLVTQRVSEASVVANGKIVGEINKGLFVLLGVKNGDTEKDADTLVEKLSKMRIMADDKDKMNLGIQDVDASVLVVSQFTLYAETKKGNRPSFTKAANPELANRLYKYFVNQLKMKGIRVQTGHFGEYMEINAKLDGPVTIIMSSENSQ
ncbi:D-aminoacyl-tRNA deacylase [Patescibacteria group bacterium]